MRHLVLQFGEQIGSAAGAGWRAALVPLPACLALANQSCGLTLTCLISRTWPDWAASACLAAEADPGGLGCTLPPGMA